MAKDSQIDPKEVRAAKAGGGVTIADDAGQNNNNNHKKQSGDRSKPGSDK